MKIAVDNIVSLNRPQYNIVFSGGEPTIYPHVPELIDILQGALGERLNRITIITNGSRNESLYRRIASIAKSVSIHLQISIHTDHVEMDHILKLIENLSADVNMQFSLMFNPAKREMVHEIFDTMLEYRKRFYFGIAVLMLRDGARVDPRYTPEDFASQKEFDERIKALAKSADVVPAKRKKAYRPLHTFVDIDENGEQKKLKDINYSLKYTNGLINFRGMYCIAHAYLLHIFANGRFLGMVCNDDHSIGNIFEKDAVLKVREKLIHPVRCTKPLCGCSSNYPIPKFASAEEAKKYVEFAQKRQAQLFDEYIVAQQLKKDSNRLSCIASKELVGMSEDSLQTYFGVADDVRKITEYEYNSGDKKSKVVYRAEDGIITEAICTLK